MHLVTREPHPLNSVNLRLATPPNRLRQPPLIIPLILHHQSKTAPLPVLGRPDPRRTTRPTPIHAPIPLDLHPPKIWKLPANPAPNHVIQANQFFAFISEVDDDSAGGQAVVLAHGALHGDAADGGAVVFELAVEALVVVLLVVEVGLEAGHGCSGQEEDRRKGGGEMHVELAAEAGNDDVWRSESVMSLVDGGFGRGERALIYQPQPPFTTWQTREEK